jgi:hypothetical protein
LGVLSRTPEKLRSLSQGRGQARTFGPGEGSFSTPTRLPDLERHLIVGAREHTRKTQIPLPGAGKNRYEKGVRNV